MTDRMKVDIWLFSAGSILLFLEYIIWLGAKPNIGKLIWMGLLGYCVMVYFCKSGLWEDDEDAQTDK